MLKNRFIFKKIFWLLPLSIAVIIMMNISSCNQGGKKGASGTECLTLTKAQMDNWFPAYSNPSDPVANKISVLEFFPAYDAGSKTYSVSVKGYNTSNAQLGNALDFSTGSACVIPDPVPGIGKHYQLFLADLNILNADGALKDGIENIKLTPQTYSDGQLKFEVTATQNGEIIALGFILPCPPCLNCRPPCPDDCTPACDSIISMDSGTITRDTISKDIQ